MARTLSGTCKKELSCPTSVVERSLCFRKSSRASRLTRQCLPTFRHGRCPSRHQRQTVVSFTPISSATSSALSSSFSVDRSTFPPVLCTFRCLLVDRPLYRFLTWILLVLVDFS